MEDIVDRTVWQEVKIGDRVAWRAKPDLHGTITKIFLTAHPFYVKWDKGTDDWYKGEDLVLLEKPKRVNDDRLLLFPETTNPAELREQYHRLVRGIQGEQACVYHDDSGYSHGMAQRGIKQLRQFAKDHPEVLPPNHEEIMDRLYY